MTDEPEDREITPWWKETLPGQIVPLAFVKIDRVGATKEWADLSAEEVIRRQTQYTAAVEDVARTSNAALPLHWQGDGVMLFIPNTDEGNPAPSRAFQVATLLWQHVRVRLNMSTRIAVGAAHVAWEEDTGQLRHPAIDQCGHLEADAPENSIMVTEDVYLALPEAEQQLLTPLGISTRDRAPTYVSPATAAVRARSDAFADSRDLALWDAFRRYAKSSEIRKLRYVGLRLIKKEPPALDIERVFVPPDLQVMGRRLQPREIDHTTRTEAVQRNRAPNEDELRAAPFATLESEETGSLESLRSVLQRTRGLVILGDPGSGKTTLLRRLAVAAAGGRLSTFETLGAPERLLPIPVSVGTLANIHSELGASCSVTDALARYFHSRNVGDETELRTFLYKHLEAGDCLGLLDGTDEVRNSAERDEIRTWLESFCAMYPKNRFIVSSRHVGYSGLVLASGVVATLRPFDDQQIRQYVEAFTSNYRRWEGCVADPMAEAAEAGELLEALGKSPRLAAVARNPFMLSALALINRAEGRLPRHRVQFYVIFARALCETWGTARRLVAREVDPALKFEEEALPILGQLALAMHEAYPTGIAPEAFVLETLQRMIETRDVSPDDAKLAAARFLERAGSETQILLERGPGAWGFLHLTFQEFFAAAGLHSVEQFSYDRLRSRLFDPRWEEILRLGVGYLSLVQNRPEAASRFVERVRTHRGTGRLASLNAVLRKHEPLAALLAAEGGDSLRRDLRRQVATLFARWVLDMPEAVSKRAIDEIAFTEFRELVAPTLLEALKDPQEFLRARAATALGALRADDAHLALLEVIKDPHPYNRARAAAAFAIGALRADTAVPALLEALKDPHDDVRAGAAAALGALRASVALGALVEALKDHYDVVRTNAASALGKLGTNAAIPALLEAVKDPDDYGLVGAAAIALAALRAEVAVPVLLKIVRDAHPLVPGGYRAAKALGLLGAEASIPVLLNALTDSAYCVRGRAATALGALRAEIATPALLKALADPDEDVRQSAASALGSLRAKTAVAALLKALGDSDKAVRSAAAESLGALRAADAVPALLIALNDPQWTVRVSAADAIGEIRAEAAIDLLVNRAEKKRAGDPERTAALRALWQISESRSLLGADRLSLPRRGRRTSNRMPERVRKAQPHPKGS